jgi:hypothetical protein
LLGEQEGKRSDAKGESQPGSTKECRQEDYGDESFKRKNLTRLWPGFLFAADELLRL